MDAKWFDLSLTVVITGLVTTALGWVLGTFRKVDRKTLDEAITLATKPIEREMTDLRERAHQWDLRAEKFATQGSIDSLKSEMERSMARVEKAVDNLNLQLIDLLSRKN
jgi:hypothetical protein